MIFGFIASTGDDGTIRARIARERRRFNEVARFYVLTATMLSIAFHHDAAEELFDAYVRR